MNFPKQIKNKTGACRFKTNSTLRGSFKSNVSRHFFQQKSIDFHKSWRILRQTQSEELFEIRCASCSICIYWGLNISKKTKRFLSPYESLTNRIQAAFALDWSTDCNMKGETFARCRRANSTNFRKKPFKIVKVLFILYWIGSMAIVIAVLWWEINDHRYLKQPPQQQQQPQPVPKEGLSKPI